MFCGWIRVTAPKASRRYGFRGMSPGVRICLWMHSVALVVDFTFFSLFSGDMRDSPPGRCCLFIYSDEIATLPVYSITTIFLLVFSGFTVYSIPYKALVIFFIIYSYSYYCYYYYNYYFLANIPNHHADCDRRKTRSERIDEKDGIHSSMWN